MPRGLPNPIKSPGGNRRVTRSLALARQTKLDNFFQVKQPERSLSVDAAAVEEKSVALSKKKDNAEGVQNVKVSPSNPPKPVQRRGRKKNNAGLSQVVQPADPGVVVENSQQLTRSVYVKKTVSKPRRVAGSGKKRLGDNDGETISLGTWTDSPFPSVASCCAHQVKVEEKDGCDVTVCPEKIGVGEDKDGLDVKKCIEKEKTKQEKPVRTKTRHTPCARGRGLVSSRSSRALTKKNHEWVDTTLEEDLRLVKSLTEVVDERLIPPAESADFLAGDTCDGSRMSPSETGVSEKNSIHGEVYQEADPITSEKTLKEELRIQEKSPNMLLSEPHFPASLDWISQTLTKRDFVAASSLQVLPYHAQLVLYFSAMEQVIRQRRRMGDVLLFHSPTLISGNLSFQKQVEQLTGRQLTLNHVRQMMWLAPHLLSLRWTPVADGAPLQPVDLESSRGHYGWDLEVEPRPFSVSRGVILHCLKQCEVDLRVQAFRFCVVEFILYYHNLFLKQENPPLPPVPLEHLSQWHPRFNLENLPNIPLAPLPPRHDSVQQVTTPVTHRSAVSATPHSRQGDPLFRSPVSTPHTPSHPFMMRTLLEYTPFRLGTSPTPSRYPLSPSSREGRSLHKTPVRSFTPVRYVSKTPTPHELPHENHQGVAQTDDEKTTPVKLCRTPLRSRTPPKSLVKSHTPQKSVVVCEKKKLQCQERDLELMLKNSLKGLDTHVEMAQDTLISLEALIKFFSRPDVLTLTDFDHLLTQLTPMVKCTHPSITQERLRTGIVRLASKVDYLITLRPSKCNKTKKLIQFHPLANFDQIRTQLLHDLAEAQKTTEALKKGKLQELLSQTQIPESTNGPLLSPFPIL